MTQNDGERSEGGKMKPISPFKFYGEDAPRKISSDPQQIVGPLMEWAQKAHWKQGGLAGHASKIKPQDALPQQVKRAREHFYEDRIKQLGMFPTREELQAMRKDLLIAWQKLPLEERESYEVMESKDLARFEEEMEVYKSGHPEYELQNHAKQMKRKRLSEMRAIKRSKKIRKDAKVDDDEADASDPEFVSPNKTKEPQAAYTTPKRQSGYTDEYEFPLSPRSIRRFKRESLKKINFTLDK